MIESFMLTPQEIAANLCDAGVIDRAAAMRLEQRIAAYGDRRAAEAREEGRAEGVLATVKKAEAAVYRTRGDRQKEAAERVLWAVKGLLPPEAAARQAVARAKDQGYRRGYRDGQQSKAYRERNPKGAR